MGFNQFNEGNHSILPNQLVSRRKGAAPENQDKAVTFRHHGDRLREGTRIQDDTELSIAREPD